MSRFDKVFREKEQANSLDKAQKPAPVVATPARVTMSDYQLDPRPELQIDHQLWMALLAAANTRDLELWGVLHCLRCGGAQLVKDKDYGMLIRPGEWEKSEYDAFRAKHLAPRRAAVVEALKAAALGKQASPTPADRVREIEPRAKALGWTHSELWNQETWLDDRGTERQSLLWHLSRDSCTKVSEVTSAHIELLVAVNGQVWPKLLVRSGAVTALFADAPDAHVSATMKKEAS